MNLKKKLALDATIKSGLTDATSRNNYREGYLAGFEKAKEMAADIAKKYGYTFDYNKVFQPWAHEANRALRAQNLEIKKWILELGEEEVKE